MTVLVVLAVAAVLPVIVAVHAAGARREALTARRSTIRSLRRLRAVVDECADARPDDTVDAVRRALTDVLGLLGCRYEPVAADDGIPELDRDGDVSTLVQRRDHTGIVLPERVSLPAGAGRFVLLGDPRRGTTPEQRVVAVAIAGLLVAALRRVDAP